jgi:hypothetical protein
MIFGRSRTVLVRFDFAIGPNSSRLAYYLFI